MVSVVRVLYRCRCFISSPQSIVRNPAFILTLPYLELYLFPENSENRFDTSPKRYENTSNAQKRSSKSLFFNFFSTFRTVHTIDTFAISYVSKPPSVGIPVIICVRPSGHHCR